MTHRPHGDLSGVARLYEDSLRKHGTAPMGVGWRDGDTHRLRFDKLCSVVGDETEITVNDLGCGFGSLYNYLSDIGRTVRHYRGFDISEDMLAEARRALPDSPNVELLSGALLTAEAEFSFASGIFNVRLDVTEGSWREHVLSTLSNMNANSTRGFAFNLLSTYVDYREDHLFYGDPCFFFDYCKREFSRSVTLLHDYPLYEWTIVVRK